MQAVLRKRIGHRLTADEHDAVATGGEAAADVAADTAGTDNANGCGQRHGQTLPQKQKRGANGAPDG